MLWEKQQEVHGKDEMKKDVKSKTYRMKICFAIGRLTNGGAERAVSIIAGGLADKGHEVYLYVFAKSPADYAVDERVKIQYMCNSYEDYEKIPFTGRVRRFRKYLKEISPDAAAGFIQAGYALYIASFGMKLKRAASLRTSPGKRNAKLDRVRTFLNDQWFRSADAVVLQCEGQRMYTLAEKWKHVVVIGNPLSEKIRQADMHPDYGMCRNLVMAGRLEKEKNYPMAFRAVKMLQKSGTDVRLHIYGIGQEKDRLKALAARYGLEDRIIFHGWASDMLPEYKKYDLFLMTSHYEGMPNALIEAMGAGMLCISTDCPTGPSDLIQNGVNGYLVKAGDAESLARLIQKAVSMQPSERAAVGVRARESVITEYACGKIIDKWEALFQELLE